MILYSISLKSKQVSKDWNYTCNLLQRTVKSIYNQTDRDFKVAIVCHEKPELPSYPGLIYHQVDFLPPKQSFLDMTQDRDAKELIGRKIGKELNADYIMVVDSDDCISAKISEFVNGKGQSSEPPDGFYADKGYIYYESSNKIVSKSELYKSCGSTVAVKSELCDAPDSWDFDELVKFINEGLFFSHGDLVEYWRAKGKVFEPFPFESSIYVRTDFEPTLYDMNNVLAASIKRKDIKVLLSPLKRKLTRFLYSKNISEDIKQEFGLYILND
ncbi:MAG: hypothetical protein AAGE96_18870 [Cyanobacteria bacterium P01_G01_bin.19]